MGVRVCNECKVEKPLEEYHRSKKSLEGRRYVCKVCRKKYSANIYKAKRLDHYIVYYIPSHHYVGVTNEPISRMHYHKRTGKNVEQMRVLYATECRIKAKYHEAMFHSVLAFEGLSMT